MDVTDGDPDEAQIRALEQVLLGLPAPVPEVLPRIIGSAHPDFARRLGRDPIES